MKLLRPLFLFALLAALLSSCAVRHPKYFMVEKVHELQIGMTKAEVDSVIGLPPYTIKSKDTTGYVVYNYVYRAHELKRVPIFMKKNSGIDGPGQFLDLFVTFSPQGNVISIESCSNCTDGYLNKSKVERPGELITAISQLLVTTIPALLVFLSANND
ncbi:MAG: hypothetical protein AAGB22_00195 [Bacteroidota bacterium]